MQDKRLRVFGPFHLDSCDERLWRGPEVIRLTRKAFAVLRYLVEHAGQLVTKDELFAIAWPATSVSDTVLAVCMRTIRQALGDNPQTPQFIETVYGRGYRFLAPIRIADRPPVRDEAVPISSVPAAPLCSSQPCLFNTVPLVGREDEYTRLQQWFAKALQGERQVVFVTGEVGIGKTTFVEAFVAREAAKASLWLGRGQCVDQYGAGEAYLPVLEALGRLCRTPGGQTLRLLLSQHAPSWLLQMPALLCEAEIEALQRRGHGATPERMLRELAEALDVLTAERPLVLVLEDLHWSDAATIALLAFVARRRDKARLLIIGTYRPIELLVRAHPLLTVQQELQQHGQCEELVLTYLPEAAVMAYLAARFARHAFPQDLVRVIHQRTNGNPLFMVAMVDALVRQGLLHQGAVGWELQGDIEDVAVSVPESLRQLIEQQLGQLCPIDQDVLEVASVAGMEFSAATVAAGMQVEDADIEARCAALARRKQFVRACGTMVWSDGTVTAGYGFIHALYQEVLYARLPVDRRVRLHQRIGERKEQGYGAQSREVAAELAEHFLRGRDACRAVQYLQYAGENALRRSAHQEVITHVTKGLEILKALPVTPERLQDALAFHVALGSSLFATKGVGASEVLERSASSQAMPHCSKGLEQFATLPGASERLRLELELTITLGHALRLSKGNAAPEVEQTFARAWQLCQEVGEPLHLCSVLGGLRRHYLNRGELQTARQCGEHLLHLAQSTQDALILQDAHYSLGITRFWLGEGATARMHLDHGMALVDRQQPRSVHWSLLCRILGAQTLWMLGYPDQALAQAHEAVAGARALSLPVTLLEVLFYAARLHQYRLEGRSALAQAEEVIVLATEWGLPQWLTSARMLRGWALSEQGRAAEGLSQIHQGWSVYRAMGLKPLTILIPLAEVYGKVGQPEEGLRLLDEGMAAVVHNGGHWCEAELYRRRGELVLQQERNLLTQAGTRPRATGNRIEQAEVSLQQALASARRQQAKSWELRAATSLSRLWQQQGKRDEVRQLLTPIYDWFTEGFDTADLQEAKTLLDEVS